MSAHALSTHHAPAHQAAVTRRIPRRHQRSYATNIQTRVGMQQPAKASSDESAAPLSEQIGILGVHHVAVIVESLERSMAFYQGASYFSAPAKK